MTGGGTGDMCHYGVCSSEAPTKEQEKEKLVNSAKPYTSPIQPSSAFHLRNRLLSRIGTRVNE